MCNNSNLIVNEDVLLIFGDNIYILVDQEFPDIYDVCHHCDLEGECKPDAGLSKLVDLCTMWDNHECAFFMRDTLRGRNLLRAYLESKNKVVI